MSKVFFSYTRRDNTITKEFLKKLKNDIPKDKIETFIDLLDNKSSKKQKEVFNQLSTSNLMIVIQTDSTYESEWVNAELNLAKQKKIPTYILGFKDICKFVNSIKVDDLENVLKDKNLFLRTINI
ncbi:MAG: TIR domain-containing protein [Erysipelotrichales bacterium]